MFRQKMFRHRDLTIRFIQLGIYTPSLDNVSECSDIVPDYTYSYFREAFRFPPGFLTVRMFRHRT
jgi:hypothetical protein